MFNIYSDKDCLKKFCESLREYPIKTVNFKKKKIKSFTNEQQKPYVNAEICYIYKEKFGDKVC